MRRSVPVCAAMVMTLVATMLVAGDPGDPGVPADPGVLVGDYTRTAGPDFDCDGVRDAVRLREGLLGIGPISNIDQVRATRAELFWGSHGDSCQSARWSNLFTGGPFVTTYLPNDDCL